MLKPSAIQVCLAKRLGLPETASKDQICRAALAKMGRDDDIGLEYRIIAQTKDYDRHEQTATNLSEAQSFAREMRKISGVDDITIKQKRGYSGSWQKVEQWTNVSGRWQRL